MKRSVAIFYPPNAGAAFDAWKTANAEALRQFSEDEIQVNVGRHVNGTYIEVLVPEERAGSLSATGDV